MRECVDCKRRMTRLPAASRPAGYVTYQARGLCNGCHARHKHAGRLLDFPTSVRSQADFFADWDILRAEGHTARQIAARLGMSYVGVSQQVARARRRARVIELVAAS